MTKNSKMHSKLILAQAIIIFIVPFICKDITWFHHSDLPQAIYIQSVSGFMILVWLFDCFFSKKFEIKKSPLYFPVIGVILWSSGSLVWSSNVTESMEVLRQWLAAAIIWFVIYNMFQTAKEISILMHTLLASMFLLVVIGLTQFFDNSFTLYFQVVTPAGSFGNKNMFCDYLIIVMPICFYLFMNSPDKTKLLNQIFAGIIFVSTALLIFFSTTKAEMLGIVILVFLFFY